MTTRSLIPPFTPEPFQYANDNPPNSTPKPLTFLFIDLVSSTKLWHDYPSQMIIYRRTYHTFIRDLTSLCHGEDVKAVGDGFFIVFTSPIKALEFSFAVQRGLPLFPFLIPNFSCTESDHNETENDAEKINKVQAKIGIHFGIPDDIEIDPITNRKDYFGLEVDTTKRLEGKCKAGCLATSEEFLDEIFLYAGVSAWELETEKERDGTRGLGGRILGAVAYWCDVEDRGLRVRVRANIVELKGVGMKRVIGIEMR